MLHSISWARFGAFLVIGLVIYYGYVLLRFYRRELWALVRGKNAGGDGMAEGVPAAAKAARGAPGGERVVGVAKVPARGDGGQAAGRTDGGQAALFPEARVGETPELFKVMEKVIVLLRQMVTEAVATGIRREELEDRIRMVLSGYRQLMGTPYQVSINNFIQRTCTTSFSLMLSDREIADLWVG